MVEVKQFVTNFIAAGRTLWGRGDPMLMGAAIAFNSLFALVPLAFAFVSIVSLFSETDTFWSNLTEAILSMFPPELADLLERLLAQTSESFTTDTILLLIASILIALWSGSRAVYAIQKSLRLMQGVVEDRGYLHARLTGVGVTIAAGVAVMVGYALLLIGENAWEAITDALGVQSIGIAQMLLAGAGVVWVFGLLYVVYRFGPPDPVPWPAITSASVAVVMVGGGTVLMTIAPSLDNQVIAVFGAIGLLLVMLYFIGVVSVAGPMVVSALRVALRETKSE